MATFTGQKYLSIKDPNYSDGRKRIFTDEYLEFLDKNNLNTEGKPRTTIQGKITQNQIKEILTKKIDVIMSDMAVNTTGIKNIDAIQTGELCIEAMLFSKDIISEKGFFISKIFMGSSFNEIVALGKKIYKEVKVFKPKSSRKDSKESFIICKNLR